MCSMVGRESLSWPMRCGIVPARVVVGNILRMSRRPWRQDLMQVAEKGRLALGNAETDTSAAMPGDTRLRVLLIAEAANPEWVSVPLVGWSIAAALRKQHDVHLVTQIRNREAILRAGLREGEDFTAIDSEAVARRVFKLSNFLRLGKDKGWTIATALASKFSYPYFERLVWQRFGTDIRAGRFDIVHRVTPLTPTANSSLAGKCARAGVPFVLGPLNGGVPWPKGFAAERWREREWLSYFRGAYKLSPGRKRMLAASAAIIAGSRTTASDLPASVASKVTLIPENAIDPDRFFLRSPQRIDGPLRGCFVGRLVPLKGLDMLIEAAEPFLREGSLTLDIVGSGPLEQSLRASATAKGVDHAVTFHGWVAHKEVQEILARANLLTFPSIREFGGGVVLEAMALGVVPMIVDYAGPGELVTDETGIKVPIGPRGELVARLRAALGKVIADPAPLRDMGTAAQRRIEDHFTWERKAAQIGEVYHWVREPDGPISKPVPLAGQPETIGR